MALGMEFLKWFSKTGRLPAKGRLLDIGESCLLKAQADEIESIFRRHGCRLTPDEQRWMAGQYAHRANIFSHPYVPSLFLGDVLKLTAVEYVALDVCSAYHAELFDLNIHALAQEYHGTFDLVLNCGTTEHLVNQFNAFKVIHDGCKVGGWMFHQVPSTGFINHGYFSYNALMFQELAAANEYEVDDLWFCGPEFQGTNVLDNGENYPSVLEPSRMWNNVEGFRAVPVPSCTIVVLLRKTRDAEFRVGLEVKTAATALAAATSYTSRYIDRANEPRRVAG